MPTSGHQGGHWSAGNTVTPAVAVLPYGQVYRRHRFGRSICIHRDSVASSGVEMPTSPLQFKHTRRNDNTSGTTLQRRNFVNRADEVGKPIKFTR